ncbi:TetR/AcrR family transcriptional regulator [Beijerinckia sp. L45]|uniref:TetR/AcrR family transcriptional regulator n=1 Tax=Beijerinckia sp. L45 TaxID=1641855 RepID=UPI001FEF308C|nr:TetR/AcrR family transcriptional regulator [Beijerinckia sp. L45]
MSTSASKKTYHHGDLRDALIVAALEVLEEGGLAGLSLREAARRAGVSAMAPYRHFADKEALIAGVAAVGFQRFADLLRQADAKPDAHEALIAQGVAYVDFACARPALFRLMFGATSPNVKGDLALAGESAYAVLATRVASLAKPAQAADWTLTCWSVVHGLAMLALDGKLDPRAESPTVLVERMLRLLPVNG